MAARRSWSLRDLRSRPWWRRNEAARDARSCDRHGPRRFADGSHNVRVRTTPTEVPAHAAPDVVVRGLGTGLEQRDGSQDLSRCAKAALQRVVRDKRLLDRMKAGWTLDAFDRGDRLAIARGRERQTGV